MVDRANIGFDGGSDPNHCWAKSMSRSVHTSRAKFRKASQFDYSTEQARLGVLGKILDETLLKRDLKEIAKQKRQFAKAGLKRVSTPSPIYAAASRKSPASSFAKAVAASHNPKGIGRR
jgi:hypothetical protein